MDKEIKKIKKKIIPILKKNKVNKAGIFGSYARGQQKKNSDVDILVRVGDKNFSLLNLIALEIALKKSLRRKVDLVEYEALHRLLKNKILKEEIRIL